MSVDEKKVEWAYTILERLGFNPDAENHGMIYESPKGSTFIDHQKIISDPENMVEYAKVALQEIKEITVEQRGSDDSDDGGSGGKE